MSLSFYLTAGGAIVVFAACSSTGDPHGEVDERACAQTYEFGNYGCAEVVGTVVDAQQHPMSGIIVGPVHLPDRGAFNTSYSETDASGRFKFRFHRFTQPSTNPDTVSLYVRAADPRSAGVGVPARVRDSVLVHVTFAPVGQIPVATTVTLSLPTP